MRVFKIVTVFFLSIISYNTSAKSFPIGDKEVTYQEFGCMLDVFERVADYYDRNSKEGYPTKRGFTKDRILFFSSLYPTSKFNERVQECLKIKYGIG